MARYAAFGRSIEDEIRRPDIVGRVGPDAVTRADPHDARAFPLLDTSSMRPLSCVAR
jgi:hypothetical protein